MRSLNDRLEKASSFCDKAVKALGAAALCLSPTTLQAETPRGVTLDACGTKASGYLVETLSGIGLQTVKHVIEDFSKKIAVECTDLEVGGEVISLPKFVEEAVCDEPPSKNHSDIGEWKYDPGCLYSLSDEERSRLGDLSVLMQRQETMLLSGQELEAWRPLAQEWVRMRVEHVYTGGVLLEVIEGEVCRGDSGMPVEMPELERAVSVGEISGLYGDLEARCFAQNEGQGVIMVRPGKPAGNGDVKVAVN